MKKQKGTLDAMSKLFSERYVSISQRNRPALASEQRTNGGDPDLGLLENPEKPKGRACVLGKQVLTVTQAQDVIVWFQYSDPGLNPCVTTVHPHKERPSPLRSPCLTSSPRQMSVIDLCLGLLAYL